jgi:hypothetical protein
MKANQFGHLAGTLDRRFTAARLSITMRRIDFTEGLEP